MIGPDPLVTVWQALDAGGYGPRGQARDFRSRCPGHDGENGQALHVALGADGRAVLHCFRGCRPEDVVDALGLQWRDLFPAGHRFNRRRPRPRPGSRGPMEIVLAGLDLVGIRVRGVWVADQCPHCGEGGLWLRMTPTGGVGAECSGGCLRDEILGALEAAVALHEELYGAR